MENSKIFHYTNLLRVELSNEIDTSEIENYFPQTISEKQSDYNSDYTINYNLSQYNYLKNIPNVQRDLTFITKAEDQCLSVACGAVISRYIFLKEMEKLVNC